jgi:hypothetical protein
MSKWAVASRNQLHFLEEPWLTNKFFLKAVANDEYHRVLIIKRSYLAVSTNFVGQLHHQNPSVLQFSTTAKQ